MGEVDWSPDKVDRVRLQHRRMFTDSLNNNTGRQTQTDSALGFRLVGADRYWRDVWGFGFGKPLTLRRYGSATRAFGVFDCLEPITADEPYDFRLADLTKKHLAFDFWELLLWLSF